MVMDLRKYETNKVPFLFWYKQNTRYGMSMAVSIYASSSHVPCLALCLFLAYEFGYTEEILRLINNFIKTYTYTKIVGHKEGFDYPSKS
jgi:hypothetical protein